MKNILVTGGAGFIGSHLIKALLDRGDSVVCVDNFNDYYSPIQKRKNISPFLENRNFKLYIDDIEDYTKMKEIFIVNQITHVAHIAARAGVRASISDPFIYESTNLKGTLNLLSLSKDFNIQNFVFASSSSVYGNNQKVPFAETDNVDFPISPYAATKKATELLAHTYHHLHNLPVICLRFFTVYGPAGRPDMAPYLFTQWIDQGKEVKRFGDGTSKRDYTYIEDIITGVVKAIDTPMGYEIINLGDNHPVELNYFISVIEKVLGKKANIVEYPEQPGDVKVTYADITKAQKLLNYQPTVSIEQGMENFIKWYLDNK